MNVWIAVYFGLATLAFGLGLNGHIPKEWSFGPLFLSGVLVACAALMLLEKSDREQRDHDRGRVLSSAHSVDRSKWRSDPKAVEAVEYLLSIGMNSDEFLLADIEESE
jgi:hypothetical protein